MLATAFRVTFRVRFPRASLGDEVADLHQHRAIADLIALGDVDRGDRARDLGDQPVLHLHRFEDQQAFTDSDLRADVDIEGEDAFFFARSPTATCAPMLTSSARTRPGIGAMTRPSPPGSAEAARGARSDRRAAVPAMRTSTVSSSRTTIASTCRPPKSAV